MDIIYYLLFFGADGSAGPPGKTNKALQIKIGKI